jgi:hypothetical protein
LVFPHPAAIGDRNRFFYLLPPSHWPGKTILNLVNLLEETFGGAELAIFIEKLQVKTWDIPENLKQAIIDYTYLSIFSRMILD